MTSFDHAGRRYEISEIYRLDLGAYAIELTDLTADPPDIVANVRCFERSSQLMVAAHPPVAAELIERLIAIARERLPHWEKNWDRE
ncbi:MAG: hypothetical protein J0H01_00545 [Rhizobiales bacterium]|nr:hypothetical protein [Hyphomicrobiales bacterium]